MASSFQNFVALSTSNGMVLPLNQISMNNTVIGKAGEFTVIRKKQRVAPLGVSNGNNNILATVTASNVKRSVGVMAKKKVMGPKHQQNVLHQQVLSSPAQQQQHQLQPQQQQRRQQLQPPQTQLENIPPPPPTNARTPKALSLPVSVARRNARERNRVQQVNNGFAALRERIPDEVAQVFESIGNGRGSVKKLSKVETLRMAVEYIRSLEQCLADDGVVPQPPQLYHSMGSPDEVDSDFNCSSSMLNTTTPPPESSEFGDDTLNLDDTDLSDISYLDQSTVNSLNLPGSQQGFIRLPTGGTFQISTPIYEPSEPNVRTPTLPFQVLDPATGFLHATHHLPDDMHSMMSPAASISPHSYDDQSLPDIKTEPCYVIVTPEQQQQLAAGLTTVYYTTTGGGVDAQSPGFDGMLTMKTELVDEDDDSREMLMTEQEHADSMIGESLEWWQKTDPQRLGSTS